MAVIIQVDELCDTAPAQPAEADRISHIGERLVRCGVIVAVQSVWVPWLAEQVEVKVSILVIVADRDAVAHVLLHRDTHI